MDLEVRTARDIYDAYDRERSPPEGSTMTKPLSAGNESILRAFVNHARDLSITSGHGGMDAAKQLISDAVGVGLAGSTTHESQMILEAVKTWGSGKDAHVWADGTPLPAALAAMINGHQMHTLEFDAIHEPSVVHPMTVVFPAILAFMERAGKQGEKFSGNDLIRAVIVGVDIAAGLGVVTTTPLRFFRPATAGALGAVAAITSTTRASIEQAEAAMGIVYSQIAGTMQPHTEGAQVLALQIGFNARAAINAWDLALAGFRGPKKIFDGKYGYFGVIEEAGDPHALVEQLGKVWEVERTSIKPFPSGRATHAALDGVLQLQQQHKFTVDDVLEVEAHVPPMVKELVGRLPTIDMQVGTARLCLAYLIPNALIDGTISLYSYSEDRLRNPQIIEAAQRVNVVADSNPNPNAFDPQTIVVRLKSNLQYSITLPASLGSPSTPMSKSQLAEKFARNLEAAGKSEVHDQLTDLLLNLENLEDVSRLIELL